MTSLNRSSLVTMAALVTAALISGCATRPPAGVEVVKNFELERYLGTWYEIARFDHSFERGLTHVTAEYSVIDAKTVRVVNSGFNTAEGKQETREGKAKFAGDKTVGSLKVSFFGPFYGGYHILALDEDYQYALVSGPTRNYLWILSRTPALEQEVYDGLVQVAADFDFDTSRLLLVDQSGNLEE
jgi:apolipoprotein D and lipocalin family protein